jgi:hypothetical protein
MQKYKKWVTYEVFSFLFKCNQKFFSNFLNDKIFILMNKYYKILTNILELIKPSKKINNCSSLNFRAPTILTI